MEKFYTIKELSILLNVDRITISNLIRKKRIDAVNVGASKNKRPTWRIYDGALQKFMAEEYAKKEEGNDNV